MGKTKKKKVQRKKKEVNQPPQLPVEKLAWQGALKLLQNRVFKIRSPQGHGTGFHIGNFGRNGQLCAVATAYHVLRSVDDWGEPVKIIHAQTGKEVLIKEDDRAIFTYPDKDLAVILFALPNNFALPAEQIEKVLDNYKKEKRIKEIK